MNSVLIINGTAHEVAIQPGQTATNMEFRVTGYQRTEVTPKRTALDIAWPICGIAITAFLLVMILSAIWRAAKPWRGCARCRGGGWIRPNIKTSTLKPLEPIRCPRCKGKGVV